MRKKDTKIVSKAELTAALFEDVLFFQIANEGAMGVPGEVVWITASGESFCCNYCFGEITLADIIHVFPPLGKCCFGIFGTDTILPKGWDYVYIGMGNHLLIASCVYKEFKKLIKNFKTPSQIYPCWYQNAFKIIQNKEDFKMKNKENTVTCCEETPMECPQTTELVFIIDRSGSMAGLEKDTIGGFNAMIEKQKREQGRALVSTVLFDNESKVLHDRVEVREVAPLTEKDYEAGGCTALLDAIGGAIHHIGNVHKYARPEDRPAHTIFIITTDGMENASHQYSSDKVKAMIRRQEEKYGWEFLFVAANIDAVETAEHIGIRRERAANYRHDAKGTEKLYCTMSATVSNYRKNAAIADNWADELNEEKK